MNNLDVLQSQYREAIRVYLWYTGSPYSFQQGKTSKDQAATYLRVAHQVHAKRREILQEEMKASE